MTLNEVKDWLKSYGLFEHYYIGKIVGKQEKTLGVYARGVSGQPVRALGQDSSYDITRINLLVHWNKYEDETQDIAKTLYKTLYDFRASQVDNDNYIYYVRLQNTEPVSVGTDANDIYEFVIDFDIYSNRRK